LRFSKFHSNGGKITGSARHACHSHHGKAELARPDGQEQEKETGTAGGSARLAQRLDRRRLALGRAARQVQVLQELLGG